MGGVADALRRHSHVGIDTSIFIYQLEDSPRYADLAEEALDTLAHRAFVGVTSVLTLKEIIARPLRLGLTAVADEYAILLTSYPNLHVVDLDQSAARRAAGLRARYRLRPADALHVAACLEHGATAFLSNDKGLRGVRDPEVILLDDFLTS